MSVDDALVGALLDELSPPRPGALPLLSHALDLTWRTRSGSTITLVDYERTGGIDKAVAVSSQVAYERLSPAQREAARMIFLRLTATTAEGTDMALPVTRAELTDGIEADDAKAVIDAFAERRLLTLAADTVEISHEVLLSAWPLLRDEWLAETRDARAIRTRLRDTAALWAATSRNKSYLYRGAVLRSAVAIEQVARAEQGRYPPFSRGERAFLRESSRASRHRVRLAVGAVGAVGAFTALTLILAWVWIADVRANWMSATEQDVATAGGASRGVSETTGDADPVRARLEAVAAWRLDPSSQQARYAMQSAAALPGIAVFGNESPGSVRGGGVQPGRRDAGRWRRNPG